MIEAGSTRPLAVLDTSFWTAAYRAEVAANCLDYFTLIVPAAVGREILAPRPDTRDASTRTRRSFGVSAVR